MPLITDEAHDRNLSEYRRIRALGYTITATESGYRIEYQGKELICAIVRSYPPESKREQFRRNFLSAALTIAREHAGEITRELQPIKPPDPLAEYRKLADGLSDMIESGRLQRSDIPDDYQWLADQLCKIAGADPEKEGA